MKTILKVIILFLIVFTFKIPYFYNTVVLSAVISIAYYFLSSKSIPFSQFKSWYVITLFVGYILIIFIDLLIITLHKEYAYTIHQKRLFLVLFMMFALVLALPIMIEGKEDHVFEEAAKIICYTFALQGAIHLTGFIYNPFGEFIISLQPPEYMEAVNRAGHANIARFRFYALSGSIFFELPSAYGVAAIMFFRLQLIKGQKYISGYSAFIVLFLLVAGISLSGRTGFIGFFLGLFYFLVFAPKLAWTKNLQKWIVCVVVLFIAFNLLSPKQRNAFYDDLFPFAFEAYYNWRDKGTFSTGSSDVTMKVHYYPLRSETVLWGHGTGAVFAGYEWTDAGYMDALIFGGIFWLLALSVCHSLYFIKPLSIANARGTPEGKHDFWCFMALFVYIFILEYKGSALALQYHTVILYLFVGTTYLIRHYYREDHGYSS
jgi:hypothetical protein